MSTDPTKMYLFATQRKALSGHVYAARAAVNKQRTYAKSHPRACTGVAAERAKAYAELHGAYAAYASVRSVSDAALVKLAAAARHRTAVQQALQRFTATLRANPEATTQPRVETLLSDTYTAQEQVSLLSAVHRAQSAAAAQLAEARRLSGVAASIAPRCG